MLTRNGTFLTLALLSLTCAVAVQAAPAPVALWTGDGSAEDAIGSNDGEWISHTEGWQKYVPGQIDQAFNMRGPNWVEVPADPSLNLPGSMTVSFWFRSSNLYSQALLYKGGSSGFSWGIHLNGENNGCGFPNPRDRSYKNWDRCRGSLAFNVRFANGKGTGVNTSAFIGKHNFMDGAWHHVVGTVNAQNRSVSVTIDGVLIGSNSAGGSGPIHAGDGPLMIGRNPNLGFDGQIDDIAIFGRVLSRSEIAEVAGGAGPSNTAPVADAGTNQTITCATSAGATVTLDGSGSYDDDGDALRYKWSRNGLGFSGDVSPTLTLPPGTHEILLDVNDGTERSFDTVTITVVEDTTPPVVTLTGDAEVTLEAAVDSYVEAGATATDDCECGDVTVAGSVDTGTPGDYTLTYSATDAAGNTGSATRTVHVVDTTPPTIALTVGSTSLWPPNHEMHLVVSGISAGDRVDGAVTPVIEVTSSEDADGTGDGSTEVDVEVVETDGGFDVYVRAERDGGGDGRVYTVTVSATDAAGNVGEAEPVEVSVVKSQGKGKGRAKPVAVGPVAFELGSASPNPFNPSTTIRFQLPEAGSVSLVVYSMTGQVVRTLVQGGRAAGVHQVEWNGRDDNGRAVSSGLYLYRLVSAGQVQTQRMTLLK